MLQSSAYRQKRRPRRVSSLSRSSSTRLLKRGESGPPCGVPSSTGLTKPFHHPGLEKRPDELEHPFIGHPRRDARHQEVVMDPVEEFFEIKVNDDTVTLGNVLLPLGPPPDGRSVPVGSRNCA